MPEESDGSRETLQLPNGEVVTPEEVFLYENYPYRVQFPDGEATADDEGDADSEAFAGDEDADGEPSAGDGENAGGGVFPGEDADYEFELSPLYWGGGEMDIPFRNREALVEQWGSESRGTLTEMEWEQWLREVRHDDRFSDEELDALARELPVSRGLVARLRDVLRL